MDTKSLLDLNKSALYDRLKKVQKIKELWVANDIIDTLSNQKERDRRLISDFTNDEIKTFIVKRISGLKCVRLFTIAGLTKYLHEGKIYDYTNACEYFNIIPIDFSAKKYEIFLRSIEKDKKYRTTSLLKWLFGKRKMCKILSDYCTISEVLNLFITDSNVIEDRRKFLLTYK